jgi:hypothetical protein
MQVETFVEMLNMEIVQQMGGVAHASFGGACICLVKRTTYLDAQATTGRPFLQALVNARTTSKGTHADAHSSTCTATATGRAHEHEMLSFVIIFENAFQNVRSDFQNLRLGSITFARLLQKIVACCDAMCWVFLDAMIICKSSCKLITKDSMRCVDFLNARFWFESPFHKFMAPKRRFWNVEKYVGKTFCKLFSYSQVLYLG